MLVARTQRLQSSSVLGSPYRVLNINHRKELLRGLWVGFRGPNLVARRLLVRRSETQRLDRGGCKPANLTTKPYNIPRPNKMHSFTEFKELRLIIMQKSRVWSLNPAALLDESSKRP